MKSISLAPCLLVPLMRGRGATKMFGYKPALHTKLLRSLHYSEHWPHHPIVPRSFCRYQSPLWPNRPGIWPPTAYKTF